MVNQTVFDKAELIIINANSPSNEEEIILKYAKEHKNIIYRKLDYRASVMETENMAIEMSTGDFIAQCCVDDRFSNEYLEIMAKHLIHNQDVDLVYADSYQTTRPNETFIKNNSAGNMYEHSKNEFSRENMIKCLPGPMPMWRKIVHEKVGFFKEDMRFAGDWEFFLRMVEAGSKFKKIDTPLALYYFNNQGLSTSTQYQTDRGSEEAEVFFKYKKVFGEKNCQMYENYFNNLRST